MEKGEPMRRITVRSVKKNPPDLSKLGRALIDVAAAEAEAQAEPAEAEKRSDATPLRCEDAS